MLPLRRLYPLIACGGVVIAAIAFVVGQIGSDPYLDPFSLTISGYAALDHGGFTEFALAAVGVASLAVIAGMRAVRAPIGGWPERLMLVWAVSTILLAIMPTTAPGPVATGVSLVVFISLPAAAGLLVQRLGADDRWRGIARPLEWLALAGGLGLAAITYVALPGHQVMIGLVERLLLSVEVSVIGVLGVGLFQIVWANYIEISPISLFRARKADNQRPVDCYILPPTCE